VSDSLLKFLFRGAPVRGGIVRLDAAWKEMIAHHDYPAPVTRLLGEMTAAVALLATNIKFNGALILQIHGDGPVKLLVVECQPDVGLRATAKLRKDAAIADDASLRSMINQHGHGRCAITLDPRDPQPGQLPYQGVVPLEGETIARALEAYMRRSEQLDTHLWLAADREIAAGMLLQKLPLEGGRKTGARSAVPAAPDDDAWSRALALAGTLAGAELIAQPPEALMRRLYWQEKIERYAPIRPRFQCSCSRERIGRMLLSLGREEVDSIIAEQKRVEVTCDFCNARRVFDAIDVAQLFATGSAAELTDTARPH
jgi:molecular chaperone Hsp33